ncbi:MAG: YciI family protein [Omnitrophica WOR_2 bacterium]
MQFLVLGYDGADEGAPARRMAKREKHIQQLRERYEQGIFLYGAAILDDAGKMTGSMIVCEFPSREALEEQWLKDEPYVIGEVWKRIEISRAQVPAFITEK